MPSHYGHFDLQTILINQRWTGQHQFEWAERNFAAEWTSYGDSGLSVWLSL